MLRWKLSLFKGQGYINRVIPVSGWFVLTSIWWTWPRMTRSGSSRRTAAPFEDAGGILRKIKCNHYCHLGMDCHFISKIVKRTVLVIVRKVAVSQRGWIHCVSQGLNSQWNIVCRRMRFWCFWGTSDSEWALFKWLDESGSKFWIQNTCGKVKSDFWNRFELLNANKHFFGSPCSRFDTML